MFNCTIKAILVSGGLFLIVANCVVCLVYLVIKIWAKNMDELNCTHK